jgi:TrmH family RNA methyltransferase
VNTVTVITSAKNPAVLAARKLARQRRARAADGRFLVEGALAIEAALDAGQVPAALLATEAASARHGGLLARARRAGAAVTVVAPGLLDGIAQTVTPQGLVAVLERVTRPLDSLPANPRLVCVLAEVRDPGNAGAVLRAADAFGADALATTAGSVDLEGPKAVRAAAGSLFHLPVIADAPWPELATQLRRRGLLLIGADPHATATVDDAPLERPCALVFGNEAHGLGDELRSSLDLTVRLPHHGHAESLNLAAAAAVLLYETAQRQRQPHPRPAHRQAEAPPSADTAVAEVVAALAHDLRSPLTGIKGFTATLLHRWERFSDEQKQHMLRTISADADRVTRLIKELLDVARIETGKLELRREPVDLPAIAESVASRFEPAAGGPRVASSFPEDFPDLYADRDKLEQVLTNLVENAVHHTEDGTVTIAGDVAGDAVEVAVRDQGSSVPAEQLPLTFTKFWQRPGAVRGAPRGTGLGLYVARGMVEAHGGAVWAASPPGGGLELRFRLPRGGLELAGH